MPLYMVDEKKENLLKLRGLYLDYGQIGNRLNGYPGILAQTSTWLKPGENEIRNYNSSLIYNPDFCASSKNMSSRLR
jgi:hypothetical protein